MHANKLINIIIHANKNTEKYEAFFTFILPYRCINLVIEEKKNMKNRST